VPDKAEKRINPLLMNTARTKQAEQQKEEKEEIPSAPKIKPTPPAKREPAQDYLPSSQVKHREVREIPFEEAYKRETVYFDRELKRRFDALVKSKRTSKTELINEALLDLLQKHNA
jgi:hypothetical protein